MNSLKRLIARAKKLTSKSPKEDFTTILNGLGTLRFSNEFNSLSPSSQQDCNTLYSKIFSCISKRESNSSNWFQELEYCIDTLYAKYVK